MGTQLAFKVSPHRCYFLKCRHSPRNEHVTCRHPALGLSLLLGPSPLPFKDGPFHPQPASDFQQKFSLEDTVGL